MRPKIAAQALAFMNGTNAEDEDGLFDGCYYVGQRSIDVGFADTLTSLPLSLFLAERFGENFVIASIETPKVGFQKILQKFKQESGVGGGVAGGLLSMLMECGKVEEWSGGRIGGGSSVVDEVYRLGTDFALWSRYGMLPPR